MELKHALSYAILCAVIVIFIMATAGLSSYIFQAEAEKVAAAQELKINQSYSAGLLEGQAQGAIEVFNIAYRDGEVMLTMGNRTYAIYSPDGCVAAVQTAQGAGA